MKIIAYPNTSKKNIRECNSKYKIRSKYEQK